MQTSDFTGLTQALLEHPMDADTLFDWSILLLDLGLSAGEITAHLRSMYDHEQHDLGGEG